jgi:hypothetical protein
MRQCVWKSNEHENSPIAGGFHGRRAIPVVEYNVQVSHNAGVSHKKRTVLGDSHNSPYTLSTVPPHFPHGSVLATVPALALGGKR